MGGRLGSEPVGCSRCTSPMAWDGLGSTGLSVEPQRLQHRHGLLRAGRERRCFWCAPLCNPSVASARPSASSTTARNTASGRFQTAPGNFFPCPDDAAGFGQDGREQAQLHPSVPQLVSRQPGESPLSWTCQRFQRLHLQRVHAASKAGGHADAPSFTSMASRRCCSSVISTSRARFPRQPSSAPA